MVHQNTYLVRQMSGFVVVSKEEVVAHCNSLHCEMDAMERRLMERSPKEADGQTFRTTKATLKDIIRWVCLELSREDKLNLINSVQSHIDKIHKICMEKYGHDLNMRS